MGTRPGTRGDLSPLSSPFSPCPPPIFRLVSRLREGRGRHGQRTGSHPAAVSNAFGKTGYLQADLDLGGILMGMTLPHRRRRRSDNKGPWDRHES